jgi:hypothetical protein
MPKPTNLVIGPINNEAAPMLKQPLTASVATVGLSCGLGRANGGGCRVDI